MRWPYCGLWVRRADAVAHGPGAPCSDCGVQHCRDSHLQPGEDVRHGRVRGFQAPFADAAALRHCGVHPSSTFDRVHGVCCHGLRLACHPQKNTTAFAYHATLFTHQRCMATASNMSMKLEKWPQVIRLPVPCHDQ